MNSKNDNLSLELQELFDLRFAKARDEKKLADDTMATQQDIRLITHMFKEDVPDVSVPLGDEAWLKWDSQSKKLFYVKGQESTILESMPKQIMIKVRPHLRMLVDQAKDFYRNDS